MALIRCPKCQRVENFHAWGKWNVCCPDCKKIFIVHISRQKPAEGATIICPRCNYQEYVSMNCSSIVKCPRCSLAFSGLPKGTKSCRQD